MLLEVETSHAWAGTHTDDWQVEFARAQQAVDGARVDAQFVSDLGYRQEQRCRRCRLTQSGLALRMHVEVLAISALFAVPTSGGDARPDPRRALQEVFARKAT